MQLFLLEREQVAQGKLESPQEQFPIAFDKVCLQFPRVIVAQDCLSYLKDSEVCLLLPEINLDGSVKHVSTEPLRL